MKYRKIISLLLAALLLATGAAYAGGTAATMDKTRVTATLGDNTYIFPMRVSECAGKGLSVTGDIPQAGQYNPDAMAADSSYEFGVRLDAGSDEAWVTGFSMKNNGARVGEMQLNQTTRAQAMGLMGEPVYAEGNTAVFEAGHGNYRWELTFDGETDGALLTGVNAYALTIARYGAVTGADAWTNDVEPTELTYEQMLLNGRVYQAGDTVQKLLDNGWVLPAESRASVLPAADSAEHGVSLTLYDGRGFVNVVAYNTTDAELPVAACAIASIAVRADDDAALILPGGYQPGACTAEDFTNGLNPIAGVYYDVTDEAIVVHFLK